VTRPSSVTDNGYGRKSMNILKMASIDIADTVQRAHRFKDASYLFSEKSLARKCQEMQDRGYIDRARGAPWHQSWLTDKGRQVLETVSMSG
jgi:CTP-dependent riboflavin kinase